MIQVWNPLSRIVAILVFLLLLLAFTPRITAASNLRDHVDATTHSADPCRGWPYTTQDGQVLCSTGPEGSPESSAVLSNLLKVRLSMIKTGSISCISDGLSGKRVQLVYVREKSQRSNLAIYRSTIQTIAAEVDWTISVSATAMGEGRRIRYVTDRSCKPTVIEAVVPDGTNGNFQKVRDALVKQGLNSKDRKYLVFSEDLPGGSPPWCGQADVPTDPQKSAANQANGLGFAIVHRFCWNDYNKRAQTAAHELMHTFGAVAYRSASSKSPNATSAFHCTDEFDIMCYSDKNLAANQPAMKYTCYGSDRDVLFFDCNGDDYFNPKPAPGSFLSRNWNAADSAYLERPTATRAGAKGAAASCSSGSLPTIGDSLDVKRGDGYQIDVEVSVANGKFRESSSRLWVDGAEIPLNYRDHLSNGSSGRVRYAPPILLGLLPDDRVDHTVILAMDAGECPPVIGVWTFKATENVSISLSPEGEINSATARPTFTLEMPGSSMYPLYPVLYLDGEAVYHPDPRTPNPWSVRRVGDRWIWQPSTDLEPGRHRLFVDWYLFPAAYGPADPNQLAENYYLPPTIGFAPVLEDSLPPWDFRLVIGKKR
jgi:hypothetical protein